MKNKFQHVAVIMGGDSQEREVSIKSGQACARALEKTGHIVQKIQIEQNLVEKITNIKSQAVFNAMHGTDGEDGKVQSILELQKIPYTHSGVAASAIAFHKVFTKKILRHSGINVTNEIVFRTQQIQKQFLNKHPAPIPYVVKPVQNGSSIGVFIITKQEQLQWQQQIIDNKNWGDLWMIEPYIEGREITCGILNDEPLELIDILTDKRHFYDYYAKYSKGEAEYVIPAKIPRDIYKNIQNIALEAHRQIGCKGASRIDFRLDTKQQIFCMEINTQPGMTETSLVPDMAKYSGMSFEKLVLNIINDASINR